MTLDFRKLVTQVAEMGQTMASQNTSISKRVETALEQFQQLPDNDVIRERVQLARVRDAGYRGVAPLDGDSEPLNETYPCPQTPSNAIVLAADGSQIYPDQHSAAFYFLTNVGLFTFFYGENRLPQEYSEPQLAYRLEDTHDRAGNPIQNAAVNAQRTVREMQTLADAAWQYRQHNVPVLAIYDGPLLFWLGKDVLAAEQLENEYHRALIKLRDTHTTTQMNTGQNASLIGYIDRPTSRFFVALLHLLALDDADVRRRSLESMGPFEGLTDSWLFREVLEYGHRSALMVQQSPQNKAYRNDVGEDYEIAFFYLNVGRQQPYITRVEMPMWVARSQKAINQVHALVMSQCEIMGGYPYALTRADELAVVRTAEKNALEDMIHTELIRNEQPIEESSKLIGKHQTRADRRRFGDQWKLSR